MPCDYRRPGTLSLPAYARLGCPSPTAIFARFLPQEGFLQQVRQRRLATLLLHDTTPTRYDDNRQPLTASAVLRSPGSLLAGVWDNGGVRQVLKDLQALRTVLRSTRIGLRLI